MKFKTIIYSLIAIAVTAACLFLVYKIIVRVPGQPGVYSPDPKTGQLEIFTTLEGKLEKVRVSEILNDFRTQPVLVSNSGELILLVGLGRIGKEKIDQYSGEVIKINGHWYGRLPFRGKKYRAFWIEGIADEKNSAKPAAGGEQAADEQKS